MSKWLLQLLAVCIGCTAAFASVPDGPPPAAEPKAVSVYVIPIRDQIGSAILYVLRRGVKEAIASQADAVIIDMKTPGGAADATLSIMEALDKFQGATMTFVNDEAGSAGALIALVTDEIYFAPTGVMGAAELITGTGADAPEALKRKMTSFLAAKVRAFSDSDPKRADVLKAMMNADFELKMDGKVLKGKGELLTLTAREAVALYGDPPEPLLASGIARDIDEVIAKHFGPARTTVTTLELTWSEQLAVWLNKIAPLLLGLGMLALFIEFKTPGFGLFGFAGITFLAVVFLSNYVAGLSGHEPSLVFAVGVALVLVELFFLPGVGVLALSGVVLMLGALVWSMADLWPNEPLTTAWAGDAFVTPLSNVALGLVIAVVLGLVLARYLPRGWFLDRLVIRSSIAGAAQHGGGVDELAVDVPGLIGREGTAVTALRPSGQVEIDGRRYEARAEIGVVDPGRRVIVRGQTDFGLIVEEQP
jgi:membrane-bound serine protease (ClpP class)